MKIAISGEYIAFYAYSQRKCWALKYTPGSIFTLFLSVFACLWRVLSKAGVSDCQFWTVSLEEKNGGEMRIPVKTANHSRSMAASDSDPQ
jgi:hypothetical protein